MRCIANAKKRFAGMMDPDDWEWKITHCFYRVTVDMDLRNMFGKCFQLLCFHIVLSMWCKHLKNALLG
jgi:hypothetical protein